MNVKKRVNGSWVDVPYYIHESATDTFTTLPAVIHTTGTTATVEIKGQAIQSTNPTPDNPIEPEFCGDLVSIELDEPLRAVGEYKDTLDLETKTYTKRICEMRATETSSVNNFVAAYTIDRSEDASVGTIYSNYAQMTTSLPTTGQRAGKVFFNNSRTYIGFGSDELFPIASGNPTQEEIAVFNEFLSTHDVKVWYVLANPIVTTISSIPDGLSGLIEGTITQSGTPSPDNPIEPIFNGKLLPNGKYQVYKTYKITIASGAQSILLDEPLRALGLYKDTIDLATKTFTKRIQELVLTGEEYWRILRGTYYIQINDRISGTLTLALCNHFATELSLEPSLNHFSFGEDTNVLFRYDDGSDVSNFKAWLSELYENNAPVKVWYALAEPIVTTISSIPDGLTGVVEGSVTRDGTPTPDNPVEPVFNGELLHNGKYKIIVPSSSAISDIYLGQTQTTRRIRRLVLTGNEEWIASTFFYTHVDALDFRNTTSGLLCSHLPVILRNDFNNQPSIFWGRAKRGDLCLYVSNTITSLSDFKSYLAQQYANGTPVVVWYVMYEPEVGIVNEPIGKLGDYVDTVSNVSIPVTAGECVLSVDTVIQPSEVTVTYKGWHPAAVHKRINGAWV